MVLTYILLFSVAAQANTTLVKGSAATGGKEKMSFTLTSSAFKHEGIIPKPYTCDGADMSPPLVWANVPEKVKSFALICDDPDAPVGNWVHWVIFNIPADTRELKEKTPTNDTLPNGAKNGVNSWGRHGYGGPCPPGGTHHYFFKLYALDTMLEGKGKITRELLLNTMKGHIVAQCELMGRYSRQK